MFCSTRESIRLLPSCDNTAGLRWPVRRIEGMAQPHTIPHSKVAQKARRNGCGGTGTVALSIVVTDNALCAGNTILVQGIPVR
jgi:hypothetical protein